MAIPKGIITDDVEQAIFDYDAGIPHPYGPIHPICPGVRTIEHFDDYPLALQTDIPAQLWEELRHEGLIAEGAPTPGAEGEA
jgi:hypothetical protein